MLTKITPASIITTVINDVTENDSDKSFTPTGRWQIISARVTVTSTATVGNRQLYMRILDGADVVYEAKAGATMPASETNTYLFGSGLPFDTAFAGNIIHVPLPACLTATPAFTIQFEIDPAIAASDDMLIQMLAEVY